MSKSLTQHVVFANLTRYLCNHNTSFFQTQHVVFANATRMVWKLMLCIKPHTLERKKHMSRIGVSYFFRTFAPHNIMFLKTCLRKRTTIGTSGKKKNRQREEKRGLNIKTIKRSKEQENKKISEPACRCSACVLPETRQRRGKSGQHRASRFLTGRGSRGSVCAEENNRPLKC